MQDESKYDPPGTTAADIAHTFARAGLGSIPFVGAAATELFQSLIEPPLQKRREKWMVDVAIGLRDLEEKQKCLIDELASNEIFIDTVMTASQAAIRTSQVEKREALRNAVLNAALPHPPDESRQQIFINLVDTLTVWHLRILRFLADPTQWRPTQQSHTRQVFSFGSVSQLLTTAFSELQNERSLYDLVGKDLYSRGLTTIESFHTTMTGEGVYAKRATPLGEQFLKFISEPV